MDGSRTMYYLVRRSSAITTAMNLKNIYVAVPGFDKGSSTSDVVNNLSAVTMEAIIRVNSFQQEISSIMGIEQYFLMRIGDKEFPNRHRLRLVNSPKSITRNYCWQVSGIMWH